MYDTFFDTGFSPCCSGGFDSGFVMPPMDFSAPSPMSMGTYPDFVWGDQIPYTPSTPPAWMTARAAQAEMHLNQLDAQLNDPNLWMQFLPPPPPMPIPTWDDATWFQPTLPPIDWNSVGMSDLPMDDPYSTACSSPDLFDNQMMLDNPFGVESAFEPEPLTLNGEEVLPCGMTQSQLNQATNKWEAMIADYQAQIDRLEPGKNMAVRAMLQNHLHAAERHLRDLDKPLGTI